MKLHLAGLVLAFALTLVACASPTRIDTPLLSPATFGMEIQASQQLLFTRDQQEHTLLAAITIESKQLRLLGLTPQGQRLIKIEFDGQKLHSEQSPLLPVEVPAQAVLQQIQLAYWPLLALQQHYRKPWSVESSPCQRQLRLEGEPIITVTYPPAATVGADCAATLMPDVSVTHHQFGNQLQVKTLNIKQGQTPP